MVDDVLMAAAFGFIGYVFVKLELRARTARSWGSSSGPCWRSISAGPCSSPTGDPMVFVKRPISAVLLLLALALLASLVAPRVRRNREQVFRE